MPNSPPLSNLRFTRHASRLTPSISRLPSLLLALFILTYALYFSWYTINRHTSLHSYAADLSLIDQPMWNTVLGPGGFMELTWGNQQQPRLAEHFEPILMPLALLFFLWDDVRMLLIAQSIALALGALPVFWIARQQLLIVNDQFAIHNSSPFSWTALTFAAAYLLFPHLQAANVADFHADPFVVTPLLFAFWYATQKRWRWMWFWAIVVMATKETLPTLTAMLGLWLITTADRRPPTADISTLGSAVGSRRATVIHGLALILASTLWFFVATFFIVAPLAQQYFGTAGPIYLASRYPGFSNLELLFQDTARWHYLLGLLTAAGFLPLLAPELLILGLPVLLANLLSNFPGQYSGEQHYSAPLVVAFILAAIYGSRRLMARTSLCENNGQSYKTTMLICVSLWLLCWALAYHARHGWTPLSTRQETYPMSAAAARLADFTAQIPADAVVSASAAIHPHLAHRRVIYVFPTVQDADYLLIDITDIPGVHPNDAYAKITELLAANWQLLQADQGLLLAQKSSLPLTNPTSPLRGPCSNPATSPQPQGVREARGHASHWPLAAKSLSSSAPQPGIPCSFFDFARSATRPTYATQLTFGDGRLRLLGYDLHDDPDNGVIFRFYWQSSAPLPEDLRLWPLIYNDRGQLLLNPEQTPMIAAVWYPPIIWPPGETVVTETLPQLLPDTFHVGLAVGPEGSLADLTRRFPIGAESDETIRRHAGHWVQLASFQRRGPFLSRRPAALTLQPLTPITANFGPAIRLTGFWLDDNPLQAGSSLPILLQWVADRPPATDFTVFIHLLAPDGHRVAQSDAYPTWLTPQPTSQWPLHQPVLDSHLLSLPPDLPAGVYTLQLGLYNVNTLERLLLPDGGDTLSLGQVQVR